LSIRIYGLLIRLASIRNPKAKLWLQGRQGIPEKLYPIIPQQRAVVWFHAASLGEFEQGRPVLEAFREKHPGSFILLTFFSPSGYEVHKNYPHADYVCYLPLDTATNARMFIHAIHPELAFFIKYEFWFNHLIELENTACRIILISGIFRPSQHFFRFWGGWFRKGLKRFEHFFVQDERSAHLLQSIGIHNFSISGDTRFDRVAGICERAPDNPLVEYFCSNHKVIIGGSTWKEDEMALHSVYEEFPDYTFVIAPHEVHESRLQEIESLFRGNSIRLSAYTRGRQARILIIDSIGLLSGIYRYGWIALVGGGFGKGIHNTLEPACFGIPIVFGPLYTRFREAVELIDCGAAISFRKSEELISSIKKWDSEPGHYLKSAEAAAVYVKRNTGGTQLIMSYLSENRKH
jgi:3-deoxy-D-manno-octulosonic-acid transferase